MSKLTRRTVLAAPLAAFAAPRGALAGKLGLQFYSLRREAAKDLEAALKLTRELGFQEVEIGSLYGRTPAEFRRLLDRHGLRATAFGSGWKQLDATLGEVAQQAHTLGARYITASQIPRKKQLTVDDALRAAEAFNRWGQGLAKERLAFCYHIHGYEFVKGPDGTLFDTLAKHMDPKLANFEMDIFWAVFGNEDPAKMLERYPGRFPLLHVKDIRHGEPRTFNPGTVQEEASVPLGKGEVDWPPVLRAAAKHGVRHYYLEEEHPNAVGQIRESLAFLEKLRLG